MFFIQISLTTKCNLACEYCPITQYRNIPPRWPLNNAELIPFLERGLSKLECGLDEVVVELTGGEPALYRGIGKTRSPGLIPAIQRTIALGNRRPERITNPA